MNGNGSPHMSFQMLPQAQQLAINMQRMDVGLGRIRDEDLHVRNLVDGGFRPAQGRFETLSPALVEPLVPMLVREPVFPVIVDDPVIPDYSFLNRAAPVVALDLEEPVVPLLLRTEPVTPAIPLYEAPGVMSEPIEIGSPYLRRLSEGPAPKWWEV